MTTTKADFDLFIKECMKWIDKLDLNNWEFVFDKEKIDADASTFSNYKSQIVFVKLDTEINIYNGMTKIQYIKFLAQHEILHVLLENLYHLARDRGWCEEDYQSEEHRIIHRLQKALGE